MIIEFTKRKDGNTVLRCVRDDGSVTWQRNNDQHARFFPFHDLIHYAVETELGAKNGFFGLVAAGWEISDTTGKSARGPLPNEALEVEHLVSIFAAVWSSNSDLNAPYFNAQARAGAATRPLMLRSLTDEEVVRIRRRFEQVATQWRDLPVGETLRLEFTPC